MSDERSLTQALCLSEIYGARKSIGSRRQTAHLETARERSLLWMRMSVRVQVFGRRQSRESPHARCAGVQKGPRHEVAECWAPAGSDRYGGLAVATRASASGCGGLAPILAIGKWVGALTEGAASTGGSARRVVCRCLVGARRTGPTVADDPAGACSAFRRDGEVVMTCRSGLCPDTMMDGVGAFRHD
jgi:hypothetical protein